MISFQLHAVNGNGLQVLQVYILGVPVTENTKGLILDRCFSSQERNTDLYEPTQAGYKC